MIPEAHRALGLCLAAIIGYCWNRSRGWVEIPLLWFMVLGVLAGHFPDFDLEIAPHTGNPEGVWKHRSPYTHSLFGLLLWPVLLAAAACGLHRLRTGSLGTANLCIVYFTIFAAYLSHLLTDIIEDYPTPILYPFTTAPYRGFVSPEIYNATLYWVVMVAACLMLTAGFLYRYYWVYAVEPQLKSWIRHIAGRDRNKE